MAAKLNYNQIISDINKRYNQIVNECISGKDYDTIVSLVCSSIYSGEDDIPKDEPEPILDENLCFKYKGYEFELSSCTILTNKEQMLGLSNDNFKQRFPHGVFTDRYVCWIYGHRDSEGYTKEESDEPDYWCPEIYLVPYAWLWGASTDLKVGSKVDKQILTNIDKFLETFIEEVHND